jgi:acid phosphatase family membrane protein YuiD
MKDVTTLLLASAVFSALAWAFWHYLGNDGFTAISTIAIVILLADNARLRNQLRSNRDARKSS